MGTKGFNIAHPFLIALINSDMSGLSDNEVCALSSWVMIRLKTSRVFHALRPEDTETDFSKCAITGLMRACVYTEFYIGFTL